MEGGFGFGFGFDFALEVEALEEDLAEDLEDLAAEGLPLDFGAALGAIRAVTPS